ncbi:MAG: T9SS type A sorting domain-containing protein [Bacteroidales bacterium]|nr:T9SS type A sorting domain-containing protein [Bacteroidales bacterium]
MMIQTEMYKLKNTAEPNPASTWVAFTYELPNEESEGTIRITDISGNLIKQFVITRKQGQYIWDTRLIKSGIYFYTLFVSGLSKSGKIVIS